MPKRSWRADDPAEQEEMTVVVLRFKGGSQSLHKGFDAVSQAISALGGASRALPARAAGRPLAGDGVPPEIPSTTDNGAGASDYVVTESMDMPASAKPKKASEPKKFMFLTDFNLSPAGMPSLKEFCADKNPQSENEKYLVVSAWLMRYGGADPFTPNHIFTCFQALHALGWKTQVDVMQPIRLMKSKRNLFANPERGAWRLTQPGMEAAGAVGQ